MRTSRPLGLIAVASILAAAALPGAAAASSPILDAVRERGVLRCGVHPGLAGFSEEGADGRRRGFDVDICRAVAAAVLGDAEQVELIPLDPAEREDALTDGRIDLLSRNTTWTFTRELTWGVFGPVVFQDGQGFLLPADDPATTLAEMADHRICVLDATTSRETLERSAAAAGIAIEVIALADIPTEVETYLAGGCDAITSDRSQLAAIRSGLPEPAAHRVTDAILSREPLAPVIPRGDEQWATVVRWAIHGLILAEAAGIGAADIADSAAVTDPQTRLLLGLEPGPAGAAGLPDDWIARMIAQVGSYAEIWDRNLGPETPLGLERGLNALWTEGGILDAPPYR